MKTVYRKWLMSACMLMVTADQIHSTNLQCEWLRDNYTILNKLGAQEYYNSLMELYASWGVDFIKVDDLSRPCHKRETEMIRLAIDRCGRPVVLSASPGETPGGEALHVKNRVNMWRMGDDVWDTWGHLTRLMKTAENRYPHIAPTWPDCDMIPPGRRNKREMHNKKICGQANQRILPATCFPSHFDRMKADYLHAKKNK